MNLALSSVLLHFSVIGTDGQRIDKTSTTYSNKALKGMHTTSTITEHMMMIVVSIVIGCEICAQQQNRFLISHSRYWRILDKVVECLQPYSLCSAPQRRLPLKKVPAIKETNRKLVNRPIRTIVAFHCIGWPVGLKVNPNFTQWWSNLSFLTNKKYVLHLTNSF